MPGLNRFLRVTPGGLLRIDKEKINAGLTPAQRIVLGELDITPPKKIIELQLPAMP